MQQVGFRFKGWSEFAKFTVNFAPGNRRVVSGQYAKE